MSAEFDALRSEVWRTASDDQLVEAAMQEAFLALLGRRLEASRALYLEVASTELRCTREWRADGLARVPGPFPLTLKNLLLPVAARAFSPQELGWPSAVGTGSVLATAYQIQGRPEGFFALVRSAPWPAEANAFLTEAVGIVAHAAGRRRAEAGMRASELRYRIVSELSTDFAFSCAVRPDGGASFEWSTTPRTLAGLPTPEPQSRNWAEFVHPEDRPLADELWRRALKNEPGSVEVRLASRQGDGGWAQLQTRPVWDALAQRVVRVFGLVRDVSERVTAERALRRERDVVRAILDASPNPVLLVSLRGVVTECNPAAWRMIGGASRAELVGQPLQRFIAERERPRVPEVRRQLEREGVVRSERVSGLDLAGRELFLEVSLGPVRTPTGELLGYCVVAQDLTTQLALDARVRQAQKGHSLEALAGGIAHDFNDLLAGIVGNAEVALQALPETSPARTDLGHVIASAERAADLTRQLLAYAGREPMALQRVDLSALVRDTTRLLESSVSKKCALRLDLARTLPLVEGDPSQLRQLLLNLVVNAAEAVGERSGAVAVRTGARRVDRAALAQAAVGAECQEGEYAFLEVCDDGRGMTPGTLARAFDPFFTTRADGRGLGLSAVQGIVRAHRGAVLVESEPDQGSTFRVLFPVAPPSVARQPTPEPSLAVGGRVLLADDEELVRRATQAMLERAGFQVEVARDGLEATGLLASAPGRFDLALLDVGMPGLDGAEVLAEVRRLRPDLPVVIASGLPGGAGVGRDDPLVEHVQKPFKRQELLSALARVRGQRRPRP